MNLEATLQSLEPAWPDTPDIAAAVQPRLAPRRGFTLRRPALVVAFATLLLAGTAVAAIPPLREWVDEIFGGRVEVREVPRLPPATPKLNLGPRLELAAARERAGFDAPYPGGFDTFHASSGEFNARSGDVLFTAVRGGLPLQFIEKFLGPGTTARRVQVGDVSGAWVEGEPHVFILRRPRGEFAEEKLRLAGNTLLWPRGDLVLRIEGASTLEEALRLAATVR